MEIRRANRFAIQTNRDKRFFSRLFVFLVFFLSPSTEEIGDENRTHFSNLLNTPPAESDYFSVRRFALVCRYIAMRISLKTFRPGRRKLTRTFAPDGYS